MRKFLCAAAVSLSLTGCAGISEVATNVAPTIAAVQSVAVSVCGFLPTASSVASIIASAVPWLSTAEAIAQAICGAVTPAKLGGSRLGAAQPRVHGVAIHGRFVR